MYGLHRLDRGPQVRIYNLTRALAALTPIELIAAERPERPAKIQAFLRDKGLSHITGLYVEANTSWANLSDLRLMLACKQCGIPIITYIRDAYPLFPEMMRHILLHKRVISSFLWRLSMISYSNLSDRLAFQTRSFAELFQNVSPSQKIILGPAANILTPPPISSNSNMLLYTGNASLPRFGVEKFVQAAEIARRGIPNLKCLLICPSDRQPPQALYKNRPWVEFSSLRTDDIPGLLLRTRVVVNPLPLTSYHHLQMPIKVMDYLSYGRPMLVTRCREIAHFVEENQVGLVVDDTPESMAEGIHRLFTAPLNELNQMGQNALRAVHEKHSWRHRAQQILDTFEEIRQSQ
jgi:glycosyltransferase involved in cell wall biosynthesis